MTEPRRVTILGSTGSVGTQAIDIVTANPERFRVTALCAAGSDLGLVARQAAQLRVRAVGVARPDALRELTAHVRSYWPPGSPMPEIVADPSVTVDFAARDADVVLNAVAGAQGLRATIASLTAGRTVALANKESLVAGGALVTELAAPGQLVPVDSEHSALAQCLRAGTADEVRRLVLTASGGPFRGRSRNELRDVTPQDALAHPTWDMGRLVTTNSATLVNKGLEMIEAHLLFHVGYERIDVVVHPQSMIHSMVEFADGSTLAQASPPDMRLPISLALDWPHRVPHAGLPLDWTAAQQWSFEPLDDEAFPAVALARTAGIAAGCAPAVFNAANEELVEAFHSGRIGFLAIVDTVRLVLEDWLSKHAGSAAKPGTVDEVEDAQSWARARARELTARD